MNDNLNTQLKQLRLAGIRQTLAVRLQEATANRLSHQQFLELVLQDELNVRQTHLIQRKLKLADFRGLKPLEDFDWDFNPQLPKAKIFELATGQFIRQAEDVLFIGPPGLGKTALSQAIGYCAIKAGFWVVYRSIFDLVRDFLRTETLQEDDRLVKHYLTADLLIIDDIGLKHLPKHAGEHLFEVVMRRHQLHATLMTSNRPIEEWGKLLADVPAATAILDRFLQRAHIIPFHGRSYRLRQAATDPGAGIPPSMGQPPQEEVSTAT